MRKLRFLSLLLALCLCLSLCLPVFAADPPEEEAPGRELHIGSASSFLDFAQRCRMDSYSRNLMVYLDQDIDLTGTDFQPIPMFQGRLEGQGHKITGLNITGDGSYQGLFRYLTESARVIDLHVEGTVAPGGTQTNVGGIAGSNAGLIEKCSFSGTLEGKDIIGGIVGINALTGVVGGCQVQGSISAEHRIGGIAGENRGVIRSCRNSSQVNISSQDNTVQVTSITLDTLTGTEDPHTVTDVGGIAGTSTGVIRDCINHGDVGYLHMGYNIGGIAGSHSGYITGCVNHGSIFARKEAGGIVGQFLPVIRIEYSEDVLQILEKQLGGASSLLNQATHHAASNMDPISDSLMDMQDSASNARDAIGELMRPGELPDPDQILAAKNALNESIQSMEYAMEDLQYAAQNTAGQLSRDLQALSGQMSAMGNTIRKAEENLGATLKDVSDQDSPEDLTGKVDRCRNYGDIDGDINAGGIAGSISFEAEAEPEDEITEVNPRSLNVKGEMRAVIRDCENRGSVVCKRLHAGGIVGLTEIGLVRDCMNTGKLLAEKAQYAGGIAGTSLGYLRSCHTKCILSASGYVGGIAGSGSVVTDCLSMVKIESATEKLGAVLGTFEAPLDDTVTDPVTNNLYMSLDQDPGGIDGISYESVAEPMNPAYFLHQEDMPEAFRNATLIFCYEDGAKRELILPVGTRLTPEQVPLLPEKEGYNAQWEELEQVMADQIYFDVVFHPLYTPCRITIRSPEARANGRPILLAEGLFPDTENIQMVPLELPPLVENSPLEAWKLPVFSESDPATLHYSIPEDQDPGYLQLLVRNAEGEWYQVPFTVNASYLIFQIQPEDNAVCIAAIPDHRSLYYGCGIAAVTAGLALIVVICHRVKAKKRRKSREDPD